jgi:hypothetical protein
LEFIYLSISISFDNYLSKKSIIMYNRGQKISSTTVIPLTYAVKQPLGTNNLTSDVDMC